MWGYWPQTIPFPLRLSSLDVVGVRVVVKKRDRQVGWVPVVLVIPPMPTIRISDGLDPSDLNSSIWIKGAPTCCLNCLRQLYVDVALRQKVSQAKTSYRVSTLVNRLLPSGSVLSFGQVIRHLSTSRALVIRLFVLEAEDLSHNLFSF